MPASECCVALWVLETMDVGKNCYESLCGFLLVDCCLFGPWQGEEKDGVEKEEEKHQEVRSNFTGDAAATVGSGEAASTWARERYL